MASNTTLNTGTGGDVIATKERTHDGDSTKVQVVTVAGVTGTEGSYTFVDVASGGGVEAAALRVTIASDSTGVLSVDDNGGSLTVDGTVTANLAAGTNNIGDVDILSIAAGDNNIGNVDVVTLPSLPAGSNAIGTVTAVGAAAEDAAASGNPVLIGGRYDSSARTLETGDAGAIALNASGQVLVEIAAGAGSGGTAAADDADFTAGTTSGTPVMGSYQSSPTAVTDGDMGIIGITADREVKVSVTSGGITGAVVDSVAGATDEGVLAIAVRDDALATLTPVDGDYTQLRTNARGAQWVCLDSTAAQTVSLAAGTNNVGDVDVLTVPTDPFGANADAASATGSISAKLRFIAATGIPITGTVTVGSHAVTNAGTFATQVDGAALTALQLIDNTIVADDAAFTPATTSVNMAGFQADETATDSVDEGDGGAARMTLDRKQIVTLQPHTQGGLSIFRSLDIDETEEDVKTSAGQLYFIHAMNMVATARYLKFYNATAANVTVGSTTPVLTFPIPANSTTGAGFTVSIPQGLAFSTAISVACTTGVADADTGAPGANDVIINIGYM